MTNIPQNAAAKPETVIANKQAVLKEIQTKWDKFSDQEISALRGKDDLVMQIVAKYGADKTQVQRDVDTLLKGRQI